VLGHTGSARQPNTGVRERLAGELTGPLRALGSADPDRDALVVACATFSLMERYLWNEQLPSDDEVSHLVGFVLRGVTREG
jgi:hypothetical protein